MNGAPAPAGAAHSSFAKVSVVVPARDEASTIGSTVAAVLEQESGAQVEVLVVDDGSDDDTARAAAAAGARVLRLAGGGRGGNPARARNRGAPAATGDVLVFLDADCVPAPGWLAALLAGHAAGAAMVGGALDLPPGLPPSARCDYYSGWYHVHSRRRAGPVPNHPPGNLSVRRDVFRATGGFNERQPAAYAHEELAWQAEARETWGPIRFEPRAVVHHRNRPSWRNLLRRNYRWGYSAIEAKAESGAARLAWLYRHPAALVLASPALGLLGTGYVVACWMRAGVYEPLLMLPGLLAARLAYSAGMSVGGWRWLRETRRAPGDRRPRWE